MKRRIFVVLLIIALLVSGLSGCKKKTDAAPNSAESEVEAEEAAAPSSAESEVEAEEAADPDSEAEATLDAETEAEPDAESDEEASSEAELIDEAGQYYSKEDVAIYLHTYGHLPDNFMTKKEARKLGWSGGSLEKFAPGMVIGGDSFGNYEGNLPEGKDYYECDIDTLGKKKRGAKRIVWSDDGYIYYTADHYETFETLYEGS